MPTITPCQRTARAGLRGGKDSALVVKYTLYFIPDHQVTFRDLLSESWRHGLCFWRVCLVVDEECQTATSGLEITVCCLCIWALIIFTNSSWCQVVALRLFDRIQASDGTVDGEPEGLRWCLSLSPGKNKWINYGIQLYERGKWQQWNIIEMNLFTKSAFFLFHFFKE